jgi:hypothetical protein
MNIATHGPALKVNMLTCIWLTNSQRLLVHRIEEKSGKGSVSWLFCVATRLTSSNYHSVFIEATKLTILQRNDSCIDLCQKVKIDCHHHRRLFWPVSQIDLQHIMHGFRAYVNIWSTEKLW